MNSETLRHRCLKIDRLSEKRPSVDPNESSYAATPRLTSAIYSMNRRVKMIGWNIMFRFVISQVLIAPVESLRGGNFINATSVDLIYMYTKYGQNRRSIR